MMRFRILLYFTLFSSVMAFSQQEFYTWKSVQIVGGGFVDGIVFHPTAKDVCYCRTDMGGAYRRNPETLRWEPILDWLSYKDLNLMGVESIALDPSDPNMVYLSCGTYTNAKTPNGAILRSADKGKTFQRTNMPFKMGGNEDGRGNGERMAVNPNNGNILFLGTRHDGLWKSTDKAVTWARVESFPDVSENPPSTMHSEDSIRMWKWMNQGSGIIFVIFDSKNKSDIYVGVSLKDRENIFRSSDGGKSWKALAGQTIQCRPTHAVLASDGNLIITYGNSPGPSRMTDGAVWKFNTKNGIWTDITPDKPDTKRAFGYAAVSVQSNNPNILIVSSYHRYGIDNGDEIFRSLDGGKSWKQVFKSGATFDASLAPYTKHTGIHWMFDIEIDPTNPNHAVFTTGYGGHETFNLSDVDKDLPTKWVMMSPGIEETVPLELVSPTKGAHLFSGIGDYGGFVHWDLDKPEPDGNLNPRFGNTNGVACGTLNPDVVVRVGRATDDNPNKNIGFSRDGGKNWQPTETMPDNNCKLGHIAVSADGAIWIWAPEPYRAGRWTPENARKAPTILPVFFTSDNGKTWTECKGIPGNTRVIADQVNSDKFYAIDLFAGKLYTSHNKGLAFTEHTLTLPEGLPKYVKDERGDDRGGQDRIYTTPGIEGDLWIAAFDGLYHSTVTAYNFVKLNHVEEIHAFGFGMHAPSQTYPAIYLVGTINGMRGFFRSDDCAKSWTRINDDAHQYGLVLHITGDPKKYGRVYVGTHGRGIIYGDPKN